MTRILLACLLVVTFESPIGNSMQGFVMRHAVQWCEGADFPILIESSVWLGADGPQAGATQHHYYAVPKEGSDQTPRDHPNKYDVGPS